MGIYAYHGERGVTIEVSSRLLQSLTRKKTEKLQSFAASILAFVRIECQLASIVGFVVVLLLTGVANVAFVPQAECIRKGGTSLERERGHRRSSEGAKSTANIEQNN